MAVKRYRTHARQVAVGSELYGHNGREYQQSASRKYPKIANRHNQPSARDTHAVSSSQGQCHAVWDFGTLIQKEQRDPPWIGGLLNRWFLQHQAYVPALARFIRSRMATTR
jgi:hypothetical protein